MAEFTKEEEVWMRAYEACIKASKMYPTRWADECLEEFRKRFPQVIQGSSGEFYSKEEWNEHSNQKKT